MMTKFILNRRFGANLTLAYLIAVNSSAAAAQEKSPQAITSGETSLSASTAAAAPGEILVTAQRRSQRLQDVGIAVTAVQPSTISNLNINSATDLVRAVPALKMNAFSTAAVVFNIRGVAQNDYGDQQEPPIAVYQDDSYASSINTASFPTFDLARVEVLRGPQGTLFGRNATGGAIQIVSKQPTRDPEGYLTITTGSFGQLVTEGALSGPLASNLQVRVAGIRDRDRGYFKNIDNGPRLGANNHYALRGILVWQPSSTVETKLTLRYLRAPHERQAGMYSLVATCPNAQFQGEYLNPNTICPYWVGVGTPTPGSTATGLRDDAINPVRGGDPWTLYQTGPNYSDRKLFGATLNTTARLGRFDLTAITDYQHSKKDYLETKYPDLGEVFMSNSKLDQVSQEVRLSTRLGKNDIVFGAYGMIIDGDYEAKYATPFIDYDPLAVFSQNTRSFAVFAQDEWRLSQELSLIGGIRYWRDRRKGDYRAAEASTGVSLVYNDREISYSSFGVRQPLTGLIVLPSIANKSYDGVTVRAEIDYKPTRSTLFYASYNRGSKSGGYTFPSSTPLPGGEIATLNNIAYKPETLNDFEVGAKLTLPYNTTFNVAGYHYIYRDYQAFVQDGPIQVVRNLNATASGIEAELATRPFRGFSLSLSGSVERSNVKHVTLPDQVTVVNHNLPQAPGFSGNAVMRYEWTVLGGTASVQADALHSGGFCFSVLCAPDEREPSYTVANARLGFAGLDDRWEIAVFVNNLTQEKYRVYALDVSLYDGSVLGTYARPRTWGLTGTVHLNR